MTRPQLYVPAHSEELGVTDWFFIVSALLFVCWLLYSGNHAGAIGWLLAASNYHTARKRFNPRVHN